MQGEKVPPFPYIISTQRFDSEPDITSQATSSAQCNDSISSSTCRNHKTLKMPKQVFFLALLSLMFAVIFAEVIAEANEDAVEIAEETDRSSSYYKCPCKCYLGRNKKKASTQCHNHYYSHCSVSTCYRNTGHHGYYEQKEGLHCCDYKPYKPTHPPKPGCPCYCSTKGRAKKDCRYLHPYCRVTQCYKKSDYSSPHYHRYPHRPRPKYYYECCDYH